MDRTRLEVDHEGELRALSEKPKRRLLARRRKLQARWSEDELREAITAAYVGHDEGMHTAAVVIHYPSAIRDPCRIGGSRPDAGSEDPVADEATEPPPVTVTVAARQA